MIGESRQARLQLQIGIRLVSPAFVGGASQASELRTPPFKALFRRWWRVVTSKSCPSVKDLRLREGLLFGQGGSKEPNHGQEAPRKSPLRLSIVPLERPRQGNWLKEDPRVSHPEVETTGMRVGSFLYLGYGPIQYDKAAHHAALKFPPCLEAGTEFELQMSQEPGRIFDQNDLCADKVLLLWHWLGTIGGRSRNGWGSIKIKNLHYASPSALIPFSRPLTDCLAGEWNQALGRDEKGLLFWRTSSEYPNWQGAMSALAETKIQLRTKLSLGDGNGPGPRHLLGYPVTHHQVPGWKKKDEKTREARLAGQLFWKVLELGEEKYVGVTAHLPHRLPDALLSRLEPRACQEVAGMERATWSTVHKVLDQSMTRWRE